MAPRSRSGIIGVLDIGTTKIVCFIAQITPDNSLKIIGIGHQLAQGIKSGAITDIRLAENSIIAAVSAAEKMAGETIDKVVVSVSGASPTSIRMQAQVEVPGGQVSPRDMKRAIIRARENYISEEKRRIIHSVPISFTVDDIRGIDDPIGMTGEYLTADVHLITASDTTIKNITNCASRCQLDVQDFVISSHAAGLSALTEDERELGVTLIEMGGGVTGISVFYHGKNIFTDSIPLGGTHVTSDIARGLNTSLACAERVKTLYGSAVPSASDDETLIEIAQMNEDSGEYTEEIAVPKTKLVEIIQPRLEEILEMVRDKLQAKQILQIASQQIVLSGGASQLVGVRELATKKFGRLVRTGRPELIEGMADSTSSAAFSASVGLINYISMNYHIYDKVEPTVNRYLQRQTTVTHDDSLIGKIMAWIRHNF